MPDKFCIFHADENYMEIHDVFSTLAKSVAKEEKKENPAPKHHIQTMNRTPGCPALMNWDSGLYNKLEAAVQGSIDPTMTFSCTYNVCTLYTCSWFVTLVYRNVLMRCSDYFQG